MKWLYYYEREWMKKGSPMIQIMLRPTIFDEEGHKMVGKIVKLNLIAAEHIMTNPKFKDLRADKDFAEVYFNELRTKDYYIRHALVPKTNELYLDGASIYVKEDNFTPEMTFEWIKTYFTVKGYECTEFEETDFNEFSDTNPLYRMLVEAGKKMVEEEEKEKRKKKKKRRKKL